MGVCLGVLVGVCVWVCSWGMRGCEYECVCGSECVLVGVCMCVCGGVRVNACVGVGI